MNIGSSILRVACDRAVSTSHIRLSRGGEYEDMASSTSDQTSLVEASPVPGTSIIPPPPQFHNWHRHQILFHRMVAITRLILVQRVWRHINIPWSSALS